MTMLVSCRCADKDDYQHLCYQTATVQREHWDGDEERHCILL